MDEDLIRELETDYAFATEEVAKAMREYDTADDGMAMSRARLKLEQAEKRKAVAWIALDKAYEDI